MIPLLLRNVDSCHLQGSTLKGCSFDPTAALDEKSKGSPGSLGFNFWRHWIRAANFTAIRPMQPPRYFTLSHKCQTRRGAGGKVTRWPNLIILYPPETMDTRPKIQWQSIGQLLRFFSGLSLSGRLAEGQRNIATPRKFPDRQQTCRITQPPTFSSSLQTVSTLFACLQLRLDWHCVSVIFIYFLLSRGEFKKHYATNLGSTFAAVLQKTGKLWAACGSQAAAELLPGAVHPYISFLWAFLV